MRSGWPHEDLGGESFPGRGTSHARGWGLLRKETWGMGVSPGSPLAVGGLWSGFRQDGGAAGF